ncbi:hypothetical protein K432DRAFT_296380 [Lepidopterella palustris CBS 459.81]|uniref:Uncharacterized protein n=1 Tax=Lepidopterella palustris CBS 459.81 TaxID=1314670 RepID=A0A8E2EBM5_9PEZI|nr:hypothetical protein K432DRAFT_296380 [Lepidopterella palustris CBS 459.81]
MGSQLRILAPQGQSRPSNKQKFRNLLQSSEPPSSPLAKGTKCDALEIDGQPCYAVLPTEGQAWCSRHFKEMKALNADWKQAQQEAEEIQGLSNPDFAKQKVLKLRLAIDLRRQVSQRFYKRGGDTADHIQWIMKLERDVRALADQKLVSSLTANRPPPAELNTWSPASAIGDHITVLQSPLDPKIPISALRDIPDDGTIIVFKHFYADLCATAVRRLYEVVPDLNDGPPDASSTSPDRRSPKLLDGGTDILRAWFRIMILNDSEAEALEHATKASTIDEFLKGRHASQVETYIDFFEKAWRPHALQYLRVAICAQTLAAREVKTISILGGVIPSTTEGLKMTKPCWDILYRWFPKLLTPWTLASMCQTFEDYTTICKLLMIGLYREHWYDPDSTLLECTTGVYLGFIPSSTSDNGRVSFPTDSKDGSISEVQCRNYITGQMAIGDPLTERLLDELRKRTERLLLVVYEGTNADATVYPSEDDLFIRRRRSAKTEDALKDAEWTTEVTLEDIKNNLRLRKSSMYDPIVVDSWQFIVIDKQPGLPFSLFDLIQDALLMLVGDPSPRQLAKMVIRDVIPPAVQQIFLDEMILQSALELRYPPPRDIQYEGNRVRCWNVEEGLLASRWPKFEESRTRDEDRFIMCVVEDMEKKGLVTLAPEYEHPQTRPLVIQGTDGGLDLYFPYDFKEKSPDSLESTTSLRALPPPDCLLEFAKSFKEKHPTALMAKGSVQTHYCAWPMPAIKRLGNSRLNFATWKGHIYYWNAMPFDRPWAERAWQYYLHHYMNAQYPFVMFYLTTFVICAVDETGVEEAMVSILDEADKHDWKLIIPPLRHWTTDIDSLHLTDTFQGIRPV